MHESPSTEANPGPPGAAHSAPPFDQDAALERLNGDQAFLETLASMFVGGVDEELAGIRDAVQKQDARALQRAAHKLKGSATPFVAAGVMESAQALETTGESGQMANAPAELGRFELEVARLTSALATLLLRTDEPSNDNPYMIAGREGTNQCTA